ncbi:MAG: DUF1684 domain-containing protein [Acidimicrobiia bacterium]|nr:DUF1684 domain-containing protein [Acidimicrobiia bacterium]
MSEPQNSLDLLGYRRIVAEMYAAVRNDGNDARTWSRWRTDRDELFAMHPQSPLSTEARGSFVGLPYFPYDPAWRIEATVERSEPDQIKIGHRGSGETGFARFGRVRFETPQGEAQLSLFWLAGYGGGLFLPFRDATSGTDTYEGGRYLLDTVKGADLGHEDDRIVLDFNYSYHPSCVHDDRWSCPLAPPENWLSIDVRAGERL